MEHLAEICPRVSLFPKICRRKEAAADKQIHERRPESSALQAQRNAALRFPTSPSDEELSAQSVSWPPCSPALFVKAFRLYD
ncbi:hypothetical protein NDU88_006186 [Pleurodeles waltl]|uniref:Uncharacterized protein n=1 Tax=Pleurodeles waltl TaxID=8319 RepID=A0AAV7PHR0_PLEWA|nr:hypothetical protein NDU88_006186 [Pleurodeles waltl]